MHKVERNCETQTEKQPSDYANNIQEKYSPGSFYRLYKREGEKTVIKIKESKLTVEWFKIPLLHSRALRLVPLFQER